MTAVTARAHSSPDPSLRSENENNELKDRQASTRARARARARTHTHTHTQLRYNTKQQGSRGGTVVKVLKADNLTTSCAVVMKSGNLNFLEPSGPLQACNGAALLDSTLAYGPTASKTCYGCSSLI